MTKSATMLSRIITVILLVGLIFGLPRDVSSEVQTVVRFQDRNIFSCQENIISVRVENVAALTAYHLEIDFTPGDLTVLSVENGGFLPTGLLEPTNAFDNTAGTIIWGNARQDYTTDPVSGSGVLINIHVETNPDKTIPFTIRPFVSGPPTEPTNGSGSMLVGWPDAMPIEFTVSNGTVQTASCPPSDITLSYSEVYENSVTGTEVGILDTIDPDNDTGFVYSLWDDAAYPDNAMFTIIGDSLRTNAVFDYETKSAYTIQVRSEIGINVINKVFTILVADVNDPPVLGTIGAQTVNELAPLTFTATATDQDPPLTPDTLTFSLTGTVPAGANIDTVTGDFSWTPTEDQGPGVYPVNVCVSDGNLSDCKVVTVTVNEVNAAPAGEDNTVSTLEDIAYEFTKADFRFSDPVDIPMNELLGVKIITLPLDGVLKVGGVVVSAGDTVSAVDIENGLFTFVPDANENNVPYASFQFKVQDDGGTDYGGADTDATTRYMTINVASVNDAPAGTNKTVTTLEDTPYPFVVLDFGFSDPNDDPDDIFTGVRISSLPLKGVLRLSGVPAAVGDVISVADISAGNLVFTPAANANGTPYTTFNFQVQDDGGGADTDPTPNTMTINVTPDNDAPVGVADHYYVNSIQIDTNGDGTPDSYGVRVPAPGVLQNDYDIDLDPLSVSVKTNPSKGTVSLAANGSFLYKLTNLGEINETDSFIYTLSDGHGGTDDVTVTITIDPIDPVVTLQWLSPVTQEEVYYTAHDDPLLLKVRLTPTSDVSRIEFRWWNTSVTPNAWVIVSPQPVVGTQTDYSYTLDLTTLPYLEDIQVYFYAYDEAGNYKRTRFFIVHKPSAYEVFLPLIVR
ncbi:MAG: Ig-like domain-containing protein [Bellilinea sp.]